MEVTYRDETSVVGVARNLTFVRIWDRPEPALLRAIGEAYRLNRVQHPHVAMIAECTSSGWLPRFTDEFRSAATELVKSTEAGSLGSAIVVSGSGFFDSAVRAFLGGVFLFAGSREPMRVFKSTPQAVAWVCSQCERHGIQWTQAQVLAEHQQLT